MKSTIPLVTLLLATVLSRHTPAADLVPEDTCLVQLQAPDGATVTLNGKSYGTRHDFRFRPMKPGKMYPIKMSMGLPDGKTVRRDLWIRGGWKVNVPITKKADRHGFWGY